MVLGSDEIDILADVTDYALDLVLGQRVTITGVVRDAQGVGIPGANVTFVGAASGQGTRVRLSDLQGQVVVLTFLYTSCPDLCPLVTGKLRKTIESLNNLTPRVAFLAVTVDPDQDTIKRVYTYSQQHGMLDRWHFLTGEAKQLQPIWEYYWVGKVGKDEKGDVMHQAPVHRHNRQGRIRVVYGNSFRPADLAHDITILLRG